MAFDDPAAAVAITYSAAGLTKKRRRLVAQATRLAGADPKDPDAMDEMTRALARCGDILIRQRLAPKGADPLIVTLQLIAGLPLDQWPDFREK